MNEKKAKPEETWLQLLKKWAIPVAVALVIGGISNFVVKNKSDIIDLYHKHAAQIISVISGILTLVLLYFYQNYRKTKIKRKFEKEGSKETKEDKNLQELIREQELKDLVLFEKNCEDDFMLSGFSFENHDLYDSLTWKFEPGINILLGRNGYGKTFVLKLLTSLIQNDRDMLGKTLQLPLGSRVSLELTRRSQSVPEKIVYENYNLKNNIGKIPLLAIPDSRFLNRSINFFDPVSSNSIELRSYGAYHFLHQLPYDNIIRSLIYELCLDYYEHGRSIETSAFNLIVETSKELIGERLIFDSILRKGRNSFEVNVITEGQKTAIPIQNASQGTLSILAIFGTIHSYLKNLYPRANDKEISVQPAIVLIDEIDAHLHPVWQKKMVRVLRDTFPNIQFILTAHSPLLVTGCIENEVAILRRSKDNKFIIDQMSDSFIGVSTEELYKRVFEVEETSEDKLHYGTRPGVRKMISKKINELQKKKDENKISPLEERELNNLFREDKVIRHVMQSREKDNKGTPEDRIIELEGTIRTLQRKLSESKNEKK